MESLSILILRQRLNLHSSPGSVLMSVSKQKQTDGLCQNPKLKMSKTSAPWRFATIQRVPVELSMVSITITVKHSDYILLGRCGGSQWIITWRCLFWHWCDRCVGITVTVNHNFNGSILLGRCEGRKWVLTLRCLHWHWRVVWCDQITIAWIAGLPAS